ncbi:MAG: hypothetical protein ACO1OG_06755 [Devosia sp.]
MVIVGDARSQSRLSALMHREYLVAVLLVVLTWLAYVWVGPQGIDNSQVITRIGLTFSIVERGALHIDPIAELTVDKSQVGEHFYADKVPGQSFLAVPVVFVVEALSELIGRPVTSTSPGGELIITRIAVATVNGLISALAAGMLYLTVRRLGAGRQGPCSPPSAMPLPRRSSVGARPSSPIPSRRRSSSSPSACYRWRGRGTPGGSSDR